MATIWFCVHLTYSGVGTEANEERGIGSNDQGTCLTQLNQFDNSLLRVVTCDKTKKTLLYAGDNRFYVASQSWSGMLRSYDGRKLLIKKGSYGLLDEIRQSIAQKIGTPVNFYCSDQNQEYITCYVNQDKEGKVLVHWHSRYRYVTIEQIQRHQYQFRAVLKAGSLKVSDRDPKSYVWALTVTELKLSEPSNKDRQMEVANTSRFSHLLWTLIINNTIPHDFNCKYKKYLRITKDYNYLNKVVLYTSQS